MIRVALVRHGETEWNGARRLQGRRDIALSETGAGQARHLGPVISAVAPQFVVTSALRRTVETARAMCLEPDLRDARLDEASLGTWEGEYSEDIRAHTPELYARWRAGTFTPPGGETFADLGRRVREGFFSAVDACAAAGANSLAIVTHGGPVRALLSAVVGLDPVRAVHTHPAGLSLLDVDPSDRSVKLRLYNYSPSVLVPDPAD